MQNPWMLVVGCGIIGYFLPEIFNIWKLRVPGMMNILCGVAVALIAGSFVL